jgi:hypothetical protein
MEVVMSAERKKVLEMLADGKITAEEADRLLEKIDGPAAPSDETLPGPRRKPKWLRINVHSQKEGENVNIKIPLGIVRAGMKLATVLPPKTRDQLNDKGIDLSALNELAGDELDEALRELTIDVDSGEGETVKIFCE